MGEFNPCFFVVNKWANIFSGKLHRGVNYKIHTLKLEGFQDVKKGVPP